MSHNTPSKKRYPWAVTHCEMIYYFRRKPRAVPGGDLDHCGHRYFSEDVRCFQR
jgi:hypothetical protein